MTRILTKETPNKIGETVTLLGWIETVRAHGKIVFIDLRDRSGIVQVVATKDQSSNLGSEYVVSIEGKVNKRPEKMINPKITTGTVEIEAQKIELLNSSKELPLPIDSEGYDIDESVRLKYRYLDLRRKRMTKNIRLRSQTTTFIRNWLTQKDFVEIETPILTKTTPEGARDFIVPSRLQPGKFYALPQSPQQYKQLLMVAGFERYFQIARCFRDEDPRKDRAYGEFTQLDLEMSFVTQNDILELTEKLFTDLVTEIFQEKHLTQTHWPRISHKDDFYHGSGRAKFAPSHHMFTAPHPEDIKLLDSDPLKVRGLQHDMALNGFEVGGGSVRIHDPKIQEKVFDLIGFTPEQKRQFDHMLKAFTFGVPPHGGVAPGIDRFLMAALSEPSVREVMAFPAIASGAISIMEAPSTASAEQLEELSISVKTKNAQK